MEDTVRIEKGALYKLKEGKTLGDIEERLSEYVYVLDYAKNPLDKNEKDEDKWMCVYHHVFKETLNPTTYIWSTRVIPYETFLEYFELDMTMSAVNKKIFELESLSLKKEDKNNITENVN